MRRDQGAWLALAAMGALVAASAAGRRGSRGQGGRRRLSASGLEYELEDAESMDEALQILDAAGADEVEVPSVGKVWVVDDLIAEWDGRYWSVSDASEYIYAADMQAIFPDEGERFNREFWEHPAGLFHYTEAQRVPDIRRQGLEARSQTRGISNRGTGAAVFTTLDHMEYEDGSYGEVLVQIDTRAMARDGLRPHVSPEEPYFEYEQLRRLAHLLGVNDEFDLESGISGNTVVVFDDIPAKYLTITEFD
jgi:hypothetical protein